MGSAGPLNRGAPDCIGQRRTSPRGLPSGVGSAGPHPGSARAEWAAPDLTGHKKKCQKISQKASQKRMSEDMSEDMPEDMSERMSEGMSEKDVRRCVRNMSCQKKCR